MLACAERVLLEIGTRAVIKTLDVVPDGDLVGPARFRVENLEIRIHRVAARVPDPEVLLRGKLFPQRGLPLVERHVPRFP